MGSLLDIAELKETVPIRGGKIDIEVPGISAEGLVYLIASFQELRQLFAGKGSDISMEDAMQQSPQIIAAILAAGTGLPGNKKAENFARELPAIDQAALMSKIWEISFPKGLKDFLEALDALADRLGGGSGKVAGMTSPGPLSSVFLRAMDAMPGATPPANSPDTSNSVNGAA